MRRVYKNLCPAMISASVMVSIMWKNSLKNLECNNNKILYETLLNFFLQRNGTYFLNKPHRKHCGIRPRDEESIFFFLFSFYNVM